MGALHKTINFKFSYQLCLCSWDISEKQGVQRKFLLIMLPRHFICAGVERSETSKTSGKRENGLIEKELHFP